jgi:predicted nuclease of restriction endonuclease-like RecB superfamily
MVTLSKAVVEFFGKKPGQTLPEFLAELKALTKEDREWYVKEFAKIGVEVEPPK